jgi:hypothetical protein
MTAVINIAEMRTRCPRCGVSSTTLSAVDVRPGFLTLRCNSCAILFDAQVATAAGQEGSVLTDHRQNDLMEAGRAHPDRPRPSYGDAGGGGPQPKPLPKAKKGRRVTRCVRHKTLRLHQPLYFVSVQDVSPHWHWTTCTVRPVFGSSILVTNAGRFPHRAQFPVPMRRTDALTASLS